MANAFIPTLCPTTAESFLINTGYSAALGAYVTEQFSGGNLSSTMNAVTDLNPSISTLAGGVIGGLIYIAGVGYIYNQNMQEPSLPMRNPLSGVVPSLPLRTSLTGTVNQTIGGSLGQALNTPGPTLDIKPLRRKPELGDPVSGGNAYDPKNHQIVRRN